MNLEFTAYADPVCPAQRLHCTRGGRLDAGQITAGGHGTQTHRVGVAPLCRRPVDLPSQAGMTVRSLGQKACQCFVAAATGALVPPRDLPADLGLRACIFSREMGNAVARAAVILRIGAVTIDILCRARHCAADSRIVCFPQKTLVG